jgi:hypothetical protein
MAGIGLILIIGGVAAFLFLPKSGTQAPVASSPIARPDALLAPPTLRTQPLPMPRGLRPLNNSPNRKPRLRQTGSLRKRRSPTRLRRQPG